MQKEITKQRQMFEREAREGQLDKLCATPFGVDVVGITEFIALTGALVGGTLITDRGTSLVLTCPINTAPRHRHQLPLPADCFLCMQGAASLLHEMLIFFRNTTWFDCTFTAPSVHYCCVCGLQVSQHGSVKLS